MLLGALSAAEDDCEASLVVFLRRDRVRFRLGLSSVAGSGRALLVGLVGVLAVFEASVLAVEGVEVTGAGAEAGLGRGGAAAGRAGEGFWGETVSDIAFSTSCRSLE